MLIMNDSCASDETTCVEWVAAPDYDSDLYDDYLDHLEHCSYHMALELMHAEELEEAESDRLSFAFAAAASLFNASRRPGFAITNDVEREEQLKRYQVFKQQRGRLGALEFIAVDSQFPLLDLMKRRWWGKAHTTLKVPKSVSSVQIWEPHAKVLVGTKLLGRTIGRKRTEQLVFNDQVVTFIERARWRGGIQLTVKCLPETPTVAQLVEEKLRLIVPFPLTTLAAAMEGSQQKTSVARTTLSVISLVSFILTIIMAFFQIQGMSVSRYLDDSPPFEPGKQATHSQINDLSSHFPFNYYPQTIRNGPAQITLIFAPRMYGALDEGLPTGGDCYSLAKTAVSQSSQSNFSSSTMMAAPLSYTIAVAHYDRKKIDGAELLNQFSRMLLKELRERQQFQVLDDPRKAHYVITCGFVVSPGKTSSQFYASLKINRDTDRQRVMSRRIDKGLLAAETLPQTARKTANKLEQIIAHNKYSSSEDMR
jgi:hypothetical protein